MVGERSEMLGALPDLMAALVADWVAPEVFEPLDHIPSTHRRHNVTLV